MANRKPLVQSGGQLTEIPTADSLAVPSVTATGFVKSGGAVSATGDASTAPWTGSAVFMDWSSGGYGRFGAYNFTTPGWVPMALVASTITVRVNDIAMAVFSSTGLDVTGESRCDTLRIDTSPTAGAVTPTHTFPVNINGTVYRVPCLI